MKNKPNQTKSFNKKERSFTNSLFKQLAESALINGDLTVEDFFNKEIVRKKVLESFPKNDESLFFVIDHKQKLLKEAIKFVKRKEYEYAYIFYSTYFEHFINEVISIWIQKNSISHEVASSLIKKVNLEDKYTWILNILKLPPFNINHWKIIKNISEKRNSYIHYKYKPKAATESLTKEEDEWKRDYVKILQAVKYTKVYRTKMIYMGKSKNLNKI